LNLTENPIGVAIVNSQNIVAVLFAMALCAWPSAQTRAQSSSSPSGACVVRAAGVGFSCPVGWHIVEEMESGTTIGDFDRPDKTGNLTIPVGRATVAVHPMPRAYKNLKEWVYAATKITPEATRANETVNNKTLGAINIVSFTSPDLQRGLAYASYFFEINGVPVNLELNYPRNSPNASKYRAIPDEIITQLKSNQH
jgi:hypothetical protein